jgi:DNA-binding transcriptional LysR family regulator
MLDVRRMKVLREVAAQGSFSAAAEVLSFTQSAVSQHVAALEREAGATLVERGPRGIKLTEAGEALVAHTDAVLARLEDAEQERAAIAGLRGGRLRFGSFPSAGATLVPRAVAVFRERHPKVDLGMAEAEPVEAVARLKAGDLELALIYDYEAVPDEADPELEKVHLLDDAMDVILPRGHRLARRQTVKLADLAAEAWIGGSAGNPCHRIMAHACNEAGFEPRIAFETDDYQAAQSFVASGVGVTMLPRLALTTVHPAVEVRSLGRASPLRRVWAARLTNGYRSPAGDAMLRILQDVAEDFHDRRALAAVS